MVETVPSWSEERVDLLRRLWEEGLSASRIATQLGGVTRNAVIGKIHRLGLSNRAKAGEVAVAADETGLAHVTPVMSPADGTIPVGEMPVALRTGSQAAPVGLPRSQRVTIMDLRESMCRWPIGDPTAPDFHFCGDRSITGLPYCTEHAQIAYQPAAERKRDRRVGGFR